MDGNTQHKKISPETATITTQKSSIFDHFWYLFELLGPPGEDLGAKRIPSGFQRPLLYDF